MLMIKKGLTQHATRGLCNLIGTVHELHSPLTTLLEFAFPAATGQNLRSEIKSRLMHTLHWRVRRCRTDLRLDDQILRAQVLCDLLGLFHRGGDAELWSWHAGVLQQGHGHVLVNTQVADL